MCFRKTGQHDSDSAGFGIDDVSSLGVCHDAVSPVTVSGLVDPVDVDRCVPHAAAASAVYHAASDGERLSNVDDDSGERHPRLKIEFLGRFGVEWSGTVNPWIDSELARERSGDSKGPIRVECWPRVRVAQTKVALVFLSLSGVSPQNVPDSMSRPSLMTSPRHESSVIL